MGAATRGGGAVESGPKNKVMSETSQTTGPVMMAKGGDAKKKPKVETMPNKNPLGDKPKVETMPNKDPRGAKPEIMKAPIKKKVGGMASKGMAAGGMMSKGYAAGGPAKKMSKGMAAGGKR
jgi:hypothetical protein